MLKELDLQIFEVINTEIDKTPTYGCYFKIDDEICICEREYLFSLKIYEKSVIIGKYPRIIDVLRFINKKAYHIDEVNNAFGFGDFLRIKVKTEFLKKINSSYIVYDLDITREIKDYTDKQKQELINFLKKV